MNRRNFIKRVGLLGAGYALNKNLMFANSGVASTATSFSSFPTVRKPISERNFKSPAIEKAIATFKQKVKNEELGWLGIVFRIRWTQPFFIQKRMADRIHM